MAPETSFSEPKWWKEAVVYQIYPASFLSTGSGSVLGWGDIRGITSKLGYLKDLGIDVVWTSPIYKSPQVDMGYDISDYYDIDPKYGTLADVDALIAGLKQRGMKLMMDLVVNHTSNQHAWFLDSRSSKSSEKRDWYIWQPPKIDADGKRQPPNNWAMILGEANSAWNWDETTQEYYLGLFTAEQPDLNWRNPKVREAVWDVMRFWLDRGVSGFRMDVINLISKVEGYPDGEVVVPDAKFQSGIIHFANGPHMHDYLQEMKREVLSKYDTITVGEMPFIVDPEEILRTVHQESGELNMIFIFDLLDIDNDTFRLTLKDFSPADMRNVVTKWQKVMEERNGWNSVFIENHDNPRSISRYCDDSDQTRDLGAKLICLMVTTLGGTLYVYQGQELGMRNVPVEWAMEEYKDVETINYWKKMQKLAGDDKGKIAQAKEIIQRKARDHSRTPVQWTPEAPNAGFCAPDVKSWMKVNDDYVTCNAQTQQGNLHSVQNFWRHAIQRRKMCADVFVYGTFECLDDEHPTVFAYVRKSVDGRDGWIVVLNFSKESAEWEVPGTVEMGGWIDGSYEDSRHKVGTQGKIALRAWEGVVGRLVKKY